LDDNARFPEKQAADGRLNGAACYSRAVASAEEYRKLELEKARNDTARSRVR